jgi:hypothetical protein
VVGRVSDWIAPDAPDATLRADSEAALRAELSWAAHLSLQARRAQPQPTLGHMPRLPAARSAQRRVRGG